MGQALGDRQSAILRAVVREYVRSGEPVGSKHVADRARLGVSPATVRNEMARLEELGYLAQPHTSAGRIPTDLGYRFVVDALSAPRALAEGHQRRLASELGGDDPTSIDELLHRASDAVSRFTHHAAAVLARRGRSSRLRRIELLSMGSRLATAVVIADNGRVDQRIIQLDETVDEAELLQLRESLNRLLEGSSLDDAIRSLEVDSPEATKQIRPVLDGLTAAFRALRASEDHVVVGGLPNLAGEETFERDELSRLYEALEHQTALLELLAGAFEPLTVRIGSELQSEDMRSCSIVVATFGPAGDAAGSIGVIGPTRMDYERVIATANTVARLLENALGPND